MDYDHWIRSAGRFFYEIALTCETGPTCAIAETGPTRETGLTSVVIEVHCR